MASQKIYTRRGDSGQTSLVDGSRISKGNTRLHAYGTVDELNSCLGVVHAQFSALKKRKPTFANKVLKDLAAIQDNLFVIGSQLACSDGTVRSQLPQLPQQSEVVLEKRMDEMNSQLPALTKFILPGDDLVAAQIHMARTICRRAERWIVQVQESGESVNEAFVVYMNRLSDYLFVLARFAQVKIARKKERMWRA